MRLPKPALTYPLLIAALTCIAASPMDDLKVRFAARLAALNDLRSRGVVGEVVDGMVAFVGTSTPEQEALVNAENADRKALYELIAAQEGISVQAVAERNARRNFERAARGEYLQGRNGKWVRKT